MADLAFRPGIEGLSAADGVRRRHWRDADKLRIVEESFVGPRQARATARRHGISRSVLTTWRRRYGDGEPGAWRPPMFMPLAVAAALPGTARDASRTSIHGNRPEVVRGNGRRLLVPADMDPEAPARPLRVTDGR